MVCRSDQLRILHGRAHPQRLLLDRRAVRRPHVHPGHVLLPRESPQDWNMGRMHRPESLHGPPTRRLRDDHQAVADAVLGVLRPDGPRARPHRPLPQGDLLRPHPVHPGTAARRQPHRHHNGPGAVEVAPPPQHGRRGVLARHQRAPETRHLHHLHLLPPRESRS